MEKSAAYVYTTGLSSGQIETVRICALTSASVSIISGIIFFYFYAMIHPSRRNFRHQLVSVLIFFDFLKAIIILLFSSLSFHKEEPLKRSTITVLGWFIVFCIEGADVIIFSFAFHMALLIFNKQLIDIYLKLKQKFNFLNLNFCNNNNDNINNINNTINNNINDGTNNNNNNNNISMILKNSQGGLYRNRHSVFLIAFLFPILVSSISLYVENTYQGYIYLPFFRLWTAPWWFSWSIRHFVDVGIMIVYVTIYIYVLIQFWKVSKSFKKNNYNNNNNNNQKFSFKNYLIDKFSFKKNNLSPLSSSSSDNYDNDNDNDNDNESFYDDNQDTGAFRNTFDDSIWYKIFKFCLMLIFPDINISGKLHGESLNTNEDLENIEKLKKESTINNIYYDTNSNDSSLEINIIGLNNYNKDINNNDNNNIDNANNIEISKQIQNLLYDEAMEKFNLRKSQIMKQMKIIFIYPISFFMLWLLPIINHYQIIKKGYETMWTTAPSAIFQPLNCFVDTMVFLFREKPWQLTLSIEDLSGIQYYDNSLTNYEIYGWRYYISFLPGYGNYRKSNNIDNDININNNIIELDNTILSSSHNNTTSYGRSDDIFNETFNINEDDANYSNADIFNNTRDETFDSFNNDDSNEIDLKDFLNLNPINLNPPNPIRKKNFNNKFHSKSSKLKNSIIKSTSMGNSLTNNTIITNTDKLRNNSHVSFVSLNHPLNNLIDPQPSTVQSNMKSKHQPIDWNVHMFENQNQKNNTYDNNSDEIIDISDILKQGPHFQR